MQNMMDINVDLLLSKFNKGIRFLLGVTDIFGKYTCHAFQKILKESNCVGKVS